MAEGEGWGGVGWEDEGRGRLQAPHRSQGQGFPWGKAGKGSQKEKYPQELVALPPSYRGRHLPARTAFLCVLGLGS